MVPWLTHELLFPPVQLAKADGLLAAGGDLRPERLLLAYSQGIFPWYGEHSPILWWAPDPRCILPLNNVYCSKRLKRKRRSERFVCTHNVAFGQVITHCANARRAGQEGTWITPAMQAAYVQLHYLGFAHSVECWEKREQGFTLVGGIYGVALGKVFFGESMFHTVSDASKLALITLVEKLRTEHFELFDCQQDTAHMLRMGAENISRDEFMQRLKVSVKK